jgi:hypothetical protein
MFGNSLFNFVKGFDEHSNLYFGVDALTDNNYYQAAVTGALNGVSGAGNFHVQALIRVDTAIPVPSSEGIFVSNIIFTPSVGGWQLSVNSSRQIQFACYNASGNDIRAVSPAVTEGEIIHVCAVHNGTQLKLFVNGTVAQSQSMTGYRSPAYVGSASRTMIGRRVAGGGLGPLGNVTVFGVAGGDFIPTDDEVKQAYVDSVRKADIVHIPNKTQHLWSVKQDQAGFAPATLEDKFSNFDMSVQGSPILAMAPPTSMTMYGIDDLNDSNYYSTPVSGGIDGITGSGNFWVTTILNIDSQAVASQNRYLLNVGQVLTGWALRTVGTNSTMQFLTYNNAGVTIASPSYTITSTDVNKMLIATCVHSGDFVRLYINGTQVGTGTANSNGYRQAAHIMLIGRYQGTTISVSGSVRIFGLCGGSGSVPSDSQILAQYEAIKTAGDIVGINGITGHLYSVKYDAVNSGSVPGVITDQISGSNFTKTGSPTLVTDHGPNIRST